MHMVQRTNTDVAPWVSEDVKALEMLGYKSDLTRAYGFWGSFSIGFNVLSCVPSIAVTLSIALYSAGLPGLSWGWPVAMLGLYPVVLSIAELSSAYPTVGQLAPAGWGPFAAWIGGWTALAGQVATPASIAWAMSLAVPALIEQYYEPYIPANWHSFLIYLTVITAYMGLTCLPARQLARISVAGTIVNGALILGFIISMLVVTRHQPHNTNEEVWLKFKNKSEWPVGFAFLQVLLVGCFTNAGVETALHLTEETESAAFVTPQSMLRAFQVTALGGFAVSLTMAYTIMNVDELLESPFGPFPGYVARSLGKEGAITLLSFYLLGLFLAGLGASTSCSRVYFAFARDGGLPFSHIWRKVNHRTKTPVMASGLVWSIGALLGCLSFAGPAAINDIFTITAISQYLTFGIPIALKLCCKDRFRPGPWNLGKWSTFTNIAGLAFVSLIVPVLCFPSVRGDDLNAKTMNYSSVAYGCWITIPIIYYILRGRKHFRTPQPRVMADPAHMRRIHLVEVGMAVSHKEERKTESELGRRASAAESMSEKSDTVVDMPELSYTDAPHAAVELKQYYGALAPRFRNEKKGKE
ncbi:hypothetical protein MNV49_000949 [Pseudohyphozyma bogoriensis]|nr:hypothetical protein MNV49_000949 [Pseudohyphozyma bogoriensis]